MTDNRTTERLRALLDERGVKHATDYGSVIWHVDGLRYSAHAKDETMLCVTCCYLTPEQAIATLGRWTCKLELATDMESIRCSACGYKLPKGTDLKATQFCGGCGCEVER